MSISNTICVSEMPYKWDWPIYRGNSRPRAVLLIDGNTAANLTNDTLKLRIINSRTGEEIAVLTEGNGITIDIPTGRVQWQPTTTLTASLPDVPLEYDLLWIRATGETISPVAGKINASGRVTAP